MDLLQLKYFQAVARLEHMTRAAGKLHIAQPSLSKSIARLEDELGVPLFDRTSRQIKLNPYGKAFLQNVDKIFIQLDDGKRQLQDMKGDYDQTIRLTFNNMYPFASLIREYLDLYPDTKFHQTIGSFRQTRQQLQDGEIDLCITSTPLTGEGIKCIPLFSEEIFLVVPQGHKFAKRKSISLIEAANEPFISLKEDFGIRDLTEKLCLRAGFIPNIIFESQIAINIPDMVSANLGIALMPILKPEAYSERAFACLHIDDIDAYRTTALSYLEGHYLSASVLQFENFVINRYKKFR